MHRNLVTNLVQLVYYMNFVLEDKRRNLPDLLYKDKKDVNKKSKDNYLVRGCIPTLLTDGSSEFLFTERIWVSRFWFIYLKIQYEVRTVRIRSRE